MSGNPLYLRTPFDLEAARREIYPVFSAPSPAAVAKAAATSLRFPKSTVDLMDFAGQATEVAAEGDVPARVRSVEHIASMPSGQSLGLGPRPASVGPKAYTGWLPQPEWVEEQEPTSWTGTPPPEV